MKVLMMSLTMAVFFILLGNTTAFADECRPSPDSSYYENQPFPMTAEICYDSGAAVIMPMGGLYYYESCVPTWVRLTSSDGRIYDTPPTPYCRPLNLYQVFFRWSGPIFWDPIIYSLGQPYEDPFGWDPWLPEFGKWFPE